MFLAKWSLNLYSLNSLKRLTHVFNFTIFLELWISCPLLFMISALLNFNRKMKFTSKSEHDWVPAKYLTISFTIEEKNSCDSKIFCYPWKRNFWEVILLLEFDWEIDAFSYSKWLLFVAWRQLTRNFAWNFHIYLHSKNKLHR